MAKNWKKEYEDLDKRYRDYREEHWNSWNKGEKWAYSFLIVLGTCSFIFLPLALFGVFDSPIEKLGIDENELVREHTLIYYPEFENCSIEYDGCIDGNSLPCKKGVEIYCDRLDSRDNLRVQRKIEPTEVLYLDRITLKDILKDIIERRYIQ